MTMRGSLSLFKEFEQQTQQPADERKERLFHAKKCECLIDRFYYYSKFTDKRYTAILEHLSQEFFLSQITIVELMEDNSDLRLELKKNPPSEKEFFASKWPHLVW